MLLYLGFNTITNQITDTNTNKDTERQNCKKKDKDSCSTCGSLILLYSAASALSSSHDILDAQSATVKSITTRFTRKHQQHKSSSREASLFQFLKRRRLARMPRVRLPPRPTGNCLIWLKQASTGASAVNIYRLCNTDTHRYMRTHIVYTKTKTHMISVTYTY